jgi:hypothetical protein
MVKLEYVEHISPETVRQALKKRAEAVAQKILVFSVLCNIKGSQYRPLC